MLTCSTPTTFRLAIVLSVATAGCSRDQQSLELMVTDIKHVLSINPLYPVYREAPVPATSQSVDMNWIAFEETLTTIGHQGHRGHWGRQRFGGERFFYDNEQPVHRQFLESFALANRPVTNREYLEFVDDGAYANQIIWLSDGWTTLQKENWTHPIYWIFEDSGWFEFTLSGKVELDPNAPVTHVSYYEADAYARWIGKRLPTEFEWEHVSKDLEIKGHFSDVLSFHPHMEGVANASGFINLFGSAWEWTNSHYSPYPGYKPVSGALGEYNGKFMANQFVLRGGSCATPPDHIRATYRNFFPAHARWQFSTIRLAKTP